MKSALLTVSLFCTLALMAQQSSQVLMKVGPLEITDREFVQVYQKNLKLVQDEEQRTMDGYLDLFIDYKLKVVEAYAQGLDTLPKYQKEFAKYEDQLARNYIYEDKLTDDLVREAYDRGQQEIDVDHIIILVGLNSLPQDTLVAYNRILSVREKALAGTDFNQLAKQYSQEPGANEHGGKLGYISAFSTVYPFETAAYQTEVGQISKIVRTQFGYHILKVNDRREKSPDLIVSHIMVADRQEAGTVDPEERIQEIYSLYKQGDSFESLAKQYSDDKGSARKGGELRPFGRGSLRSKKFESKAYELKKIGQVSDPFQSEFGWHIVRLDSVLPIKGFNEQEQAIRDRISKGNRAKVIGQNLVERIKDQYGFTRQQSYLEPAMRWVSDSVMKRAWVLTPLKKTDNPVLFNIGGRDLRLEQYGQYLEKRQKRIKMPTDKGELLTQVYFEFEQLEVEQFLKDRLEEDNEEYALVVNEYREGLLIFEVMSRSVWSKARTDSVGLEAYFNQHRDKYTWKDRVDAEIYSSTEREVLEDVKNRLAQGEDSSLIREKINTEDRIRVLYTTGIFEEGDRRLPTDYQLNEGVSAVIATDENYVLIKSNKLLKAGPKSLDESKGQVLSDYQVLLEKDWMRSLKGKYPVEVEQQVFDKLKREN